MLISGLVFDVLVHGFCAFSGSQENVVAMCCQVGNYSEILLGVGTVVLSKICF